MADQKISDMTAASSAADADLLPIVQGGVNKKVTRAVLNKDYVHVIGRQVPTGSQTRLWLPATGTGNLDLYTVASGKRVMFSNWVFLNNSGGSITQFAQAKIGGSYYPLIASAAVNNNTSGAQGSNLIMLNAGESFSYNVTATGGMVGVNAYIFDDTCGLFSVRLTSFINGDNTLYTVPANKVALFFAGTFTPSGSIFLVNRTGGSITHGLKYVPSGGSTYTTGQSTSISDNTGTNLSAPIMMAAGDSIILNSNSSTTGQFAYGNVLEIDA